MAVAAAWLRPEETTTGQTGTMPDVSVPVNFAPPGLHLDARLEREGFALTVHIDASEGEVVGIVGEVGSGKSTVLEALVGRLRLTAGRLVGPDGVWDDPVAGLWRPPAQRPVAYLPARPVLVADVAAVAQVRVGWGPEVTTSPVSTAAETVLEELGLDPAVYQREGWTLSGGETQRVALARCFVAAPSVIILDDPLAALHGRTRVAVADWIAARLAARSATVILACSDPADTRALADRVLQLG